jgi:hypothetical protein
VDKDRGSELAERLKGIEAAVREADAGVAELQRAVESLLAEVRAARAAVTAPGPARRPPARTVEDPHAVDAARLVAIELADAGATREQVERHLGRAYPGLADAHALLDDVFGEQPRRRRASSL